MSITHNESLDTDNVNPYEFSDDYIQFLANLPISWYIVYALNCEDIIPKNFKGSANEIIKLLRERMAKFAVTFADAVVESFDDNVRGVLRKMVRGGYKEFGGRNVRQFPSNESIHGEKRSAGVTYIFDR